MIAMGNHQTLTVRILCRDVVLGAWNRRVAFWFRRDWKWILSLADLSSSTVGLLPAMFWSKLPWTETFYSILEQPNTETSFENSFWTEAISRWRDKGKFVWSPFTSSKKAVLSRHMSRKSDSPLFIGQYDSEVFADAPAQRLTIKRLLPERRSEKD